MCIRTGQPEPEPVVFGCSEPAEEKNRSRSRSKKPGARAGAAQKKPGAGAGAAKIRRLRLLMANN